MAVMYRLEKLNEVQFAYDEERRAYLEAKGFRVVCTQGSAEPDAGPAESMTEKPEPDKKPAKRRKTAKEEDKDA